MLFAEGLQDQFCIVREKVMLQSSIKSLPNQFSTHGREAIVRLHYAFWGEGGSSVKNFSYNWLERVVQIQTLNKCRALTEKSSSKNCVAF